jgi:hypothetical protein
VIVPARRRLRAGGYGEQTAPYVIKIKAKIAQRRQLATN